VVTIIILLFLILLNSSPYAGYLQLLVYTWKEHVYSVYMIKSIMWLLLLLLLLLHLQKKIFFQKIKQPTDILQMFVSLNYYYNDLWLSAYLVIIELPLVEYILHSE
jgi:hypothetical protein